MLRRLGKYRLWIVISIAVFAIAIPITVSQTQKQQETRSRAAGNPISLAFSPSAASVQVRQAFTSELQLNANGNMVTGVDVSINYNKSTLEIVRFTPSSVFNDVLINKPNNASGNFRYVAVTPNTPSGISGLINLGTLTLKGKVIGSSTLAFTSTQITAFDVATSLLSTNTPATYTFTQVIAPDDRFGIAGTCGVAADLSIPWVYGWGHGINYANEGVDACTKNYGTKPFYAVGEFLNFDETGSQTNNESKCLTPNERTDYNQMKSILEKYQTFGINNTLSSYLLIPAYARGLTTPGIKDTDCQVNSTPPPAPKPGIRYYAVANEPDSYPRIEPVDYAKYYNLFYKRIKKYDPNAKVMIGGLLLLNPADLNPAENTNNQSWLYLFRKKYKEIYGVYPPVDIWNIHPYVDYDNWTNSRDKITRFKTHLNNIGEGNKPIWITEFGVIKSEGELVGKPCPKLTPVPSQIPGGHACLNSELQEKEYQKVVDDVMNPLVNWLKGNAGTYNIQRWFWYYGGQEYKWRGLDLVLDIYNYDSYPSEYNPLGKNYKNLMSASIVSSLPGQTLRQTFVDSNGQDGWYRECSISTSGIQWNTCPKWNYIDMRNYRGTKVSSINSETYNRYPESYGAMSSYTYTKSDGKTYLFQNVYGTGPNNNNYYVWYRNCLVNAESAGGIQWQTCPWSTKLDVRYIGFPGTTKEYQAFGQFTYSEGGQKYLNQSLYGAPVTTSGSVKYPFWQRRCLLTINEEVGTCDGWSSEIDVKTANGFPGLSGTSERNFGAYDAFTYTKNGRKYLVQELYLADGHYGWYRECDINSGLGNLGSCGWTKTDTKSAGFPPTSTGIFKIYDSFTYNK